jgi:hypothetical protein
MGQAWSSIGKFEGVVPITVNISKHGCRLCTSVLVPTAQSDLVVTHPSVA